MLMFYVFCFYIYFTFSVSYLLFDLMFQTGKSKHFGFIEFESPEVPACFI